MATDGRRLTIIGDIGVDLVLGPLSSWPQAGTETLMERSELRAGGSAGNAALAVSYLGGHARLLSVVGNDESGAWLSGQLRPLGGTLFVAGQDMRAVRRDALYTLRKRMGMLFQNGALLTDLSVFENVAFPLREHTDLPERLIRLIVLTKLQAVGLRGAAPLMPAELSGGMARRVALARAVVMDPEILIYDEPFVGLDPISLGMILRLIRRLNDTLGLTSIVVSHDVHEITQVADRVYLLSGGQVAASGTPAELESNPSAVVKQFVGGLPDGPVPFHYPAPDYFGELLERTDRQSA